MKDSNLENFDILDSIDLSTTNLDNQLKSSLDEKKIFEQNIELSDNNLNLVENNWIDLLETNIENNLINESTKINDENTNNILENIDLNKNIKKTNSVIIWMIFLVKYVLTSSLIFWVLLVSTNYSAYLNVAKSYIFKWELESKGEKLITSVEAANIKEKYSEEKMKELNQDKNEDSQLSIKKMKKEQDKENIDLNIDITPYENRIVIPKIWKNIPLLDIKNRKIEWQKELNNIFMKELEKGIIRYPGSAKPWQEGTAFIFGHSSNFPWIKWDYNDVFALLDKVVYNDEIIVYYWQEKFVYKITEKKVITPWDVSVLERNKKKSEITLMTCWPIWTTLNRLIVVWELVKK